MTIDFDKIWRRVKSKPNVWGLSRTLKPKIIKGEETEKESIRVYVHRKIPEEFLYDKHIVPKEIQGVPTDLVEIKQPEAPPPGLEVKLKKKGKTDKIRPVIYGISIGNWAITAGSNGASYRSKDHPYLFGSNAHVLTPDPSMTVEEVKDSEIRIVQPGKFDSASLDDIVAHYVFHKQIHPARGKGGCPTGRFWGGVYNVLARLFGAKTRLRSMVEEPNHIDFSVAEPIRGIRYEDRFYDEEIDFGEYGILGHWFAGSSQISLGVKIGYIIEEGYEPIKLTPQEPEVGMIAEKSGRTTCYEKGKITDDSMIARVCYGGFLAEFHDIYGCEPILKGGDSGSAALVELE